MFAFIQDPAPGPGTHLRVGSLLGLLGAIALTRVMAALLFGVSRTDLVTFSTVPVLLLATAMLATYIPARRETRVDPVVALRDE